MIVAVDFDGTIVEFRRSNPDLGIINKGFAPLMPGVKPALKEIKRTGDTIIIWTCRKDSEELKGFLVENDIPFDGINTLRKKEEWGLSNKLAADIYIDDRSIEFLGDGGLKGFSWDKVIKAYRRYKRKTAIVVNCIDYPYGCNSCEKTDACEFWR
jgi:hypothetical protein